MSEREFSIELEETPASGRYVIALDDHAEAIMTFRKLDENTIAIDHTVVPNEYRGHGLAAKLVERGIADARARGWKIQPICSYVVAQFRRHPDWADVHAA